MRPDIAPFAPRLSTTVRHGGTPEPHKQDKGVSDTCSSDPETAPAGCHGETGCRTSARPLMADPRWPPPGFRAPSYTSHPRALDTTGAKPLQRHPQTRRARVDELLRVLRAGMAPRQIQRRANIER